MITLAYNSSEENDYLHMKWNNFMDGLDIKLFLVLIKILNNLSFYKIMLNKKIKSIFLNDQIWLKLASSLSTEAVGVQ